ncbi:hypothetical protein ACFYXC_40820 [Streptomyces sp. NPDC002701]|uniref:hypothetical protein n=1 Tax=Streptomyces sp. NPDC002701 TaxID=3364661 RepID=UPI00368CCEF2
MASVHFDGRVAVADAAGLQRGRLSGLVLKGEDLIDAGRATRQISLDPARENRLAVEAVSDRIRHRFGAGAIGPAAALLHAG